MKSNEKFTGIIKSTDSVSKTVEVVSGAKTILLKGEVKDPYLLKGVSVDVEYKKSGEDLILVSIAREIQSNLSRFKKNLDQLLRAAVACLWIRTSEESRALKVINQVVENLVGEGSLFKWDCRASIEQYIDEDQQKDKITRKIMKDSVNPSELFTQFATEDFKIKSVMVVLDFNFFLGDDSTDPSVIRSIKDSLHDLRRDAKIVIFLGPRLPITAELEKDVTILDFPLPGREELKSILEFVIFSARRNRAGKGAVAEKESADKNLALEDAKEKLIDAALGLTSQEAEDAFSLAIIKNINLNGDSVKTVLDQKVQILKKEGILEYITSGEKMEDVGGLNVLKDWLVQRKRAFGKEASDFGLPPPKGILLVGISGCGKSLTAKAAAANWEIGLYRLDIGKIFTELMGKSEGNARRVIGVAETVAPCVLWVDEIEKGMAGVRSSGELDSGVTARVTGTILTWMQEKTAPVFVIATANDVTKLPPELLRKGRFDEVFFVDLPNLEERKEIVRVQLKKKARSLSETDIARIAEVEYATKDSSFKTTYTGAEIEQAFNSALYVCFEDGKRSLTADDVVNALKCSVPIAFTMKDETAALQKWGNERARKATSVAKKVQQSQKGRAIDLF